VEKIIVGFTTTSPVYFANFHIITNVATYGPFGTSRTDRSFPITMPNDKTVVGFFAYTDTHVRSIGVYTI
jgi:hypothetical protein